MTRTRQTVQLSPDVAAILDDAHARDRRTRDRRTPVRPSANPPRVSLRLDCPQWLRLATGNLADELDTSISQIADWLIAYALVQYRAGDPAARELLDLCHYPGHALRFGSVMDLDEMHDRLVQAEAQFRGGPLWSVLHVPADADINADIDENTGAAIDAAIPSRVPILPATTRRSTAVPPVPGGTALRPYPYQEVIP
jgi:hypothetical protein